MACLGTQNVSFGGRRLSITGGSSEEIIGEVGKSMIVLGDHRRRERCSPRMCVGGLRDGVQLAPTEVKSGSRKKKITAAPELDRFIKESVPEIVRNIKEAPFLVQVYSDDVASEDGNLTRSSSPLRLVIEKDATTESWPFITQSWEGGNNSTPDGVILVEELANSSEEIGSSNATYCNSNRKAASSAKVLGLLVQGRGVSYPACYILKTCQVQCCFGFSTHFCLSKVDCFGQDLDFHLNKLWLQR